METGLNRSSWSVANLNAPWHTVILVCFVAILSYCVTRLGVMLSIGPHAAGPLWLGNVVLVSILLLVPRRVWPILIPAAFAAFVLYDVQGGWSIRSIALFVLADTVDVLTAALCLRYAFGGVPRLNSVRALAKFSLFAVILPRFLGAFFIALATKGNYWVSWRIAFFSEAIVYLTLMPAILGCLAKNRHGARNHALITGKPPDSSEGWWFSLISRLRSLGDTAQEHCFILSCRSCFGPLCVSDQPE
jgi:integral membrane sensor domain MASE1